MERSKNRLFIALISQQTRNEDKIRWEIIVCGIILIILLFIILLLCDRYNRIFCCPTIRAARQETTEYVKISIFS
jgi:hypothetical protein